MPFNGAGTYTRSNGVNSGSTTWDLDRLATTKITSARHDAHDNDVATALSNTICKDGQTTVTADIPFAGFSLTNIGVGAARTSAARVSQLQDSTVTWCGASGGAANAQTLTPSPTVTAYASGQRFAFRAGFTNTAAAPTLNVSGVGAKVLRTPGDEAIPAGYIRVNALYAVEYHASFNGAAGAWAIVESSGAYIAETVERWVGADHTIVSGDLATGFYAICSGTSNTDGTGAKVALYGISHATLAGNAYLVADGGTCNLRAIGGGNTNVVDGHLAFQTDGKGLNATQSAAITATGTDQAGAAALTRLINYVTSGTPVSGISVKLMAASAGFFPVFITNVSGLTINVFPASGDAFNDSAADAAITLANRTSLVCWSITNDIWGYIKSA